MKIDNVKKLFEFDKIKKFYDKTITVQI